MTALFIAFFALALADETALRAGHRELSDLFELGAIIMFAVITIGWYLTGHWIFAGTDTVILAGWAWRYWNRRRKRRKPVVPLLGEKSRALVASLVARVREAAKPRPVLRPQRIPG